MIARIEQNAGGCGFDLVRDPESVFPASAMAWAAIFMCMRFLKRLKVGRQSVIKYSHEDHLCSNIFGFTGRAFIFFAFVGRSPANVCALVGRTCWFGWFGLGLLEIQLVESGACQHFATTRFNFCYVCYDEFSLCEGQLSLLYSFFTLASFFPSHSHFHNPTSQEVAA
jgi:hypothetical protein